MGRRGARPRLSDSSVILLAPLDESDPSAKLAISTVVSATLRVYDARRVATITADLAATGTLLQVDDNSDFAVGDIVQIRLEDTVTLHDTTIGAVNSNGVEVTLDDAIPASRTAKKGALLQKPLLDTAGVKIADAAMTLYGTPSTTNLTDWGWIGFCPDDADLWDIVEVREEVDFQHAAGKRIFKHRLEPVVWED